MDSVARLSAFFGVTIDDRRPTEDGLPLRIATLCYRQNSKGELVFLLLCPRGEDHGWSLPEGYPARALSMRESAMRISLAEAGVRGIPLSRELVRYPRSLEEQEFDDGDVSTAPDAAEAPEEDFHSPLVILPVHVRVELPSYRKGGDVRRRWFNAAAAISHLSPHYARAVTAFIERTDARAAHAEA